MGMPAGLPLAAEVRAVLALQLSVWLCHPDGSAAHSSSGTAPVKPRGVSRSLRLEDTCRLCFLW